MPTFGAVSSKNSIATRPNNQLQNSVRHVPDRPMGEEHVVLAPGGPGCMKLIHHKDNTYELCGSAGLAPGEDVGNDMAL